MAGLRDEQKFHQGRSSFVCECLHWAKRVAICFSGSNSRIRSTRDYWLDIIEVVVAHGVGFPSRRIVQGVRSCVVPMPIEVEFGQGRAGPESANRSLVTFGTV